MKKLSVILLGLAWLCLGLVTTPAQDSPPVKSPTILITNTPAPAPKPQPVLAPPAAAPKPAPAPSLPSAEQRNIRFQFDGIPYPDVLERFAQMANKPLLADTKIEGTLTFNDPKPYNYQEALDTLNLILSMKNVMLVEDGHYLRIVPFKELPQMPLPILHGVEKVDNVRPGEVVTVVLDLKNLDAHEVSGAITNLLSTAGSVAPLSRGRGLIVTDRLMNIQRIRSLITAVDTESVAERQMRTYTLLHASGAVIADLLNRTFGVVTAPKRTEYNPSTKRVEVLPPDPDDYITAVYDDASRTLVIFGPRERLLLADELVSRFEDSGGGAGDVRIYTPQITKPEELANMIRQAIPGVASPGEAGSSAATKARVIADTENNRLIVAAPLAGQADQIEQLINRLDKPVHGNGGTLRPTKGEVVQLTKIFRTRAAEATNVATILREALTRRLPNGVSVPTANVTVEPKSQSVVVTGSPGDIQVATDLVSQLETGSTMPRPQQTQFIDLGSPAEAKRLTPLVEQIYRSQVTDSLSGAVASARIMPEPETGRIIVSASEEHLKIIEEIVTKLRADKNRPMQRRLQIVELKQARLETVGASLTSLINERMADKRFEDQPKPSVITDNPNNRLLITATDDQFKEIDQIMAIVDIMPEKQKREMAVLPVLSKTPAEIIALVTQLSAQLGEQPSNPQLEPKLLPDATGKQIIVLAAPKDIERVRALVQQLDNATIEAVARQFRGVDLHGRNATEFTPLVQKLYQEQLKGQQEPAGGPAMLIPDPKNNRIMVSGAEKEIARVETIIRQLDPLGAKGAREETRVIRLKAALASEISSLVEKSLNTQSQQIKVLVDARSNSLVISGDSEAVEAASKVIQQLDTRSDVQPREMRVIELKHGEAAGVSSIATSLSTELLKDQRGPEYSPQMKIIPDALGNRLILSGPKNELETANKVIEQLDQAPEGAGGAQVFKLVNADASKIVGVVSNAMVKFDVRNQPIRRVSVSVDRESNSIVVSGPRADLKDAEAIIQRLDNEGFDPGNPTERMRQLKLMEVQSTDPDGLAAMAMKVFSAQNSGRTVTNLVSITPEPNGKRIIILAPPKILQQVETVITALDSKPDQGLRELSSIELKNARASDLLTTVNRIYSEQTQGKTIKPASIYADATGGRIMVFGTQEQAAGVRQIIETLETKAQPERETKVFDLGQRTEAQRLMPLVTQLYQDQYAKNPSTGPADAQIVSDGRTGRLVVSARPDHLKAIEKLIADLQPGLTNALAARETRAFEVGSAAEVQRLQPLVQQLYTDQWKPHSESDPADAQILSDARAGRLIVTGKPEHVKRIEAIVNELTGVTGGAAKPRRDKRETRIIDLTTASAVELATTVKTLYTEQSKERFGGLPSDTLITPDVGGNRLIVVGDTNEVAVVEDIVKKLDKVSAQGSTARLFKIKSADPAKVAEILTAALVRYDAYGRPQKRTAVSVDTKSRTLIVTGEAKELQSVSVIIEQLDATLGEQPARQTKVAMLKQGKASEVAAKLRQLYADRVKTQPDLGTTEVLIVEEATSNQLILAGNETQLKIVDEILELLEKTAAGRPERETKIFEVGRAEEVQRLLPLVQQLYTDHWKSKNVGDSADAQLLADPTGRRIIVTGRPDHLKEIESILTTVRSGVPKAEPRDTRAFDLTTATATELATTVRTLYQEQCKNRTNAPPPNDTLIVPDVSGNRLVVSGETNELAIVEEIISKLDKVSAHSASTRIIKLKSAEPEAVAQIMTQALVKYDNYGRPQKRASVVVDAKTRTIIITGEPKELQAASLIIEELDSAGQMSQRQMKVVPVKVGRVTGLATQLRSLYQDQVKGQPAANLLEPLITEDTTSNQLILAGADEQLKLIEQILGRLQERAASQPPRETKVIEIGQADELRRLQPLVQQLYTDQWKSKDASDAPDAQIVTDTKNARFIVTGRPDHLKEIESIIKTLRGPVADEASRQTRVFDLTTAQASELSRTVQSLYTQQLQTRSVQPLMTTLIMPDLAANRLVVSGLSNEVSTIEDIITKLDKANALSAGTRVFKLTNAEPEQVGSVLSSSLVRITSSGRSVPRITVGVDTRSRTLIVSGEPKDLNDAATIVQEFDRRTAREPRQMRIIPLKVGTATDVSTRLRSLYLDQLQNSGQPTDADALILADDQANRLIITASASQMKSIEDILKKLEEAGEGAIRQVQVVSLNHVAASPVAQMITQLYARQIASRDPAQRIAVTASPDDRTLLVDADTPTLTRINQLVQTLDQTSTNAQAIFQTIQLKKAEATVLAEAVTKAIASRETQAYLKRVNVTPVVGANALLLNGPGDAVAEVLKIVHELDQESEDGEVQVRIYQLKSSDAREIMPVLSQLLAGIPSRFTGTSASARSRSRSSTRPSVTVMERSNTLIVTGTETHFKLIEQLLPTLDQTPERSDRDVHFVWLKKAKAADVVTKVEAVYTDRRRGDRPVIEADEQANSITVIAKRVDLLQIQDLINRLDETGRDTSLQVRLRTLDRIPAEQMARMLTNIYPQIYWGKVRVVEKLTPQQSLMGPGGVPPGTPQNRQQPTPPVAPTQGSSTNAARIPGEVVIALDRDANALILSGPTEELDQIDRIITDLQYTALGGDSELHVFPLKEADPIIVARMLNDLFRTEQQPRVLLPRGSLPLQPQAPPQPPKMVVVAEPRTRSIIVRAKATDFALMETLIKQLDAAGVSAQLDFRLITLTNAPSEKIAPLVQSMARQMSLVRPGDSLTVTPYPRTRSLLVFARAPVIDQVEKLIRTLDTPPENAEAVVRVFTLKKASAGQLSTVLQNMLKVTVAGDLTPEARELQEQVRKLQVRNEKGETVTLDLTKPIKIMTDPATGQRGANRLLISSTPDNLVALAAVVEMLDQVTLTEGVDVNMVHLLHADATTVSKTLTTIFAQGQSLGTARGGQSQPEGQTGKALTSPLNVSVDERLNTLILSGQQESLALAKKIIEDLDKPVERFLTEVKLFRLNHASASRVLPLLQSVFMERASVPGTEGVSTFVTRLRTAMENGKQVTAELPKSRPALVMQADDTINVLIVAARTDALPLIEEVIKQLDIPEASGLAKIRVYPLQHADAIVLQRIITDLYRSRGPTAIRPEERPNITIDERSNSMIVSATDKAFAIIDSLLLQLDKQLPIEFRDIHLIPLAHADAAELAATVQKLMDARITRQSTLGKGQAETLRVLVLPEPRSNSLLVGGGKDSFELVESLAKQLDSAEPALSGRVRLVPMEYADARLIASSLTTLFTQRYAASRTQEMRRNRPVILADVRVNALMISAAMDDNQIIDDLIKKLDRKLDNPALTLTVLPMKYNDAARVSTTLQGIFAARLKARTLPGEQVSPSEQVAIEIDSLNNALIVSANKENLELIQELLQRIDAEPTVAGGVLETFVLQHADAQRVSTLLRGLVQQGMYRPGRPLVGGPARTERDALAIAVDPRSNTLIVSASPENLGIVKQVIAKLDTQDFTEATNIKLYRLEKSRADNVARVLTQFFQAKRAGDAAALNAPERSIPVAVIPDNRINALLVTGSKEAFDILDRIVPQLDGEDMMAQLNFRVFPLKQATATKLQVTLQRLFVNRPARVRGEPVDPITVIADAWVNALIVGAVVEDMGMVESLISRLDSEQADLGITVQVIPLLKADARRVAQTVQSLYRDGSAGPTTAFPIVVSADERVNALIVSGGETDLKRIKEVVAKLDTDQVARVSEIRVMQLKYARAELLATTLNAALNTRPPSLNDLNPNAQSVLQFITRTEDGRDLVTAALKESVLITADPRMNSLIVSGPVDYMGLLEQIVTRLDNSSPRQAKIKVFTLQNANAYQTSQLLQSLFRMQVTGGQAASQRTIEYTLVKPSEGGEHEVASAILGSEEQTALTVTVDPRTNSLLVGGTEQYVGLVAEVIDTLDSSDALERRTEMFRLKNLQALDVATAVRSFLDQERQRVTQVLGADAVSAAQRMLEREVSIVGETNSNTILLSASPRYFEQVRQMVEELDQPQSQVLVQVLLAEVSLDVTRELGVEWSYTKKVGGGNTFGTKSDFGLADQVKTLGGYSATLSGGDFNFLLRALENDGRMQILSRPQILTADNKVALVNVGQRVPLITDSRVTVQGDTINSFRYEDIGVNLMITPHISSDGFVRLDVATTNSSLSSSTVEINKSATVPIIDQRRATTTVSVQSGQTVVIGGLISTNDDIRKKKVPFFGDIPYLGVLFRSSKKISDRRELLIMLTPQVLVADNTATRISAMNDLNRRHFDRSMIKDFKDPDSLQKIMLEPLQPPEKGKQELKPSPMEKQP